MQPAPYTLVLQPIIHPLCQFLLLLYLLLTLYKILHLKPDTILFSLITIIFHTVSSCKNTALLNNDGGHSNDFLKKNFLNYIQYECQRCFQILYYDPSFITDYEIILIYFCTDKINLFAKSLQKSQSMFKYFECSKFKEY